MLSWFLDNLGTIVISALVLLAAFFAARNVRRERKNGGSCSCGGNCTHCSGSCHSTPEESVPADIKAAHG